MSVIKRMDIKEFRSFGFLQEVNRMFFHPLGLALEVVVDDETGEEKLGGIWDYRDEPEGIRYDLLMSLEALDKKRRVDELRDAKFADRLRILGYIIQPVIYEPGTVVDNSE